MRMFAPQAYHRKYQAEQAITQAALNALEVAAAFPASFVIGSRHTDNCGMVR